MNFESKIALAVREQMKSPEFLVRAQIPVAAQGRVFFVMNQADAGYVDFVANHPAYDDAVDAVYTTAALAEAAVVSNRNDIIALNGHGSHSNAMITISKNRIHFIGMDGGGRMNSQGAKMVTPATSVAASVAVVRNTGTRNTFRNIKFIQSGTNVAQTSGFIDEGEGTYMKNCEMEVNSILSTASQGLLFAGDTCHYEDCQIGNSTVYHTAANQAPLVIKKSNSAYARYSYFINCEIINYSSQTTASCIDAPEADGVIGWIKFKNCQLISANLGDGATAGGTMAEAVTSILTSGYLYFDMRCNSYRATKFAEADSSIMSCATADGKAAADGGKAIAGA